MSRNQADNEGKRERRHGHHAGVQSRRFTPVRIGIGLGVVLLGGTALVSVFDKGRPADARTAEHPDHPAVVAKGSVPTALPPSAGPVQPQAQPVGELPPPPPGVRVPVNDIDPFSGKS